MLSKSDLNNIKTIIYDSGIILERMKSDGLEVFTKSDGSLLTNADLYLSDYITSHLKHIISDMPIVSEEAEIPLHDGSNFWLLDPLDGTKSYILNRPFYTINIGLVIANKAVSGFVLHSSQNKLYMTSELGELIIEHDYEKLGLKHPKSNLEAVLNTDASEESYKVLEYHKVKDYRLIPGAIKLCLIASGEADLYPRFGNTMEWDTAAGHAIIKASGGQIIAHNTELLYGKHDFLNHDFIAFSKRLHNK
jgi:3'(2'), 5'-bisphosphate nucleotidase